MKEFSGNAKDVTRQATEERREVTNPTKLMLTKTYLAVLALALAMLSPARAQEPTVAANWEQVMAKGILPYHQLTVDDFPVNDSAHPGGGFYIAARYQPYFTYFWKSHSSGWIYAYIDQWKIFSGLDKNETSRKSHLKNMKAELPFAQAFLDLNEIYARQIAALKPGELPVGRGATPEAARADLDAKLKTFIEAKYAPSKTEMEAFSKATKQGADKKKVRELATEIRKRLDATPATTVPYPEPPTAASPPTIASPAPSASPSPAAP